MRRTSALLMVIGLLVSVMACGSNPAEEAAARWKDVTPTLTDRKPNIVRILTDDQDLSSMVAMPKTKRLLGERGVTYANTVISLSLCCPSRATLLTGQYAHNHGVWDNGGKMGGYNHFQGADNSLAPWLKAAGYTTSHVGKYMNNYNKARAKQIPKGWDNWFTVLDEATESYPYYDYTISDNGESRTYGEKDEDYLTDVFTAEALRSVKDMAASGQPFFLDYWPTAPHSGRGRTESKKLGPVPAPKYENANEGVQAPRTPNFLPETNDIPKDLKDMIGVQKMATGAKDGYAQLIDDSYRDYLSSLLSVDDMVESLVNELEASGQLQNTIIVFMSDNGLAWGNHGMVNFKWEPYEESLRVPLIISGPGFPRGVVANGQVANIDIVPTLVQAAGAKAGRVMDGQSLLPAPSGPDAWMDRAVLIEASQYNEDKPYQFANYPVPRFRGVHTSGFQYTEWTDGFVELFDLTNDVAQMHNLAADPRYAENRAKLSDAIKKLDTCAGPTCQVEVPGLTHPT
jgi:N-acetylglucosamine-6-sulfatase